MAYLFGWQAADLGATSSKNIAGPDVITLLEEAGGFVVAEDCTLERVFINTINADSRAFKIYIYDADTGALLAASAEHYSVSGGLFVSVPDTPLVAGQKIGIGYHSDTYIQADRESTPYRYFGNMNLSYVSGPTDPFAQDSTANTGRIEIWADGTVGGVPTVTVSDDLQPGASFTLNYSNYDSAPVSPATITDSNGNSLTVAVTISDTVDGNGRHGGAATGTMPALPSSGTATGLLFGTVTIELGTA